MKMQLRSVNSALQDATLLRRNIQTLQVSNYCLHSVWNCALNFDRF